MEKIPLPNAVTVIHEDGHEATFEISPYYPGYGPTVGNALRRVLLSSLPGAAITAVRIDGVEHEFSTIPGVKEDVVSVILNLKRVRLNIHRDEPIELTLKATGERIVTAGDFTKNADVEVANPDLTIATITDAKTEFVLRATAQRGRGYVPVEQREEEDRALGEIAVDAMYTPVERVSFRVENIRVGKETEFHKLIMTIRTDGTVTPRDVLSQAASILEDHYHALVRDLNDRLTYRREASAPDEVAPLGPTPTEVTPLIPERLVVSEDVAGTVRAPEEPKDHEAKLLPITQFPVNTRLQNVLEKVGIRTVAGLVQKTRAQMLEMEGIGEKAIEEIEEALRALELSLREEQSGK